MHRSTVTLGLVLFASSLVLLPTRVASACGGCFQVPQPPNQVASDVTDERMLLSVSPTQTTLYDQIRYSGSPSSFAWVLPIRGAVTVGLSADILFDAIDVLTATTMTPPPSSCPTPSCGGGGFACGGESSDDSAAGAATGGPSSQVSVIKHENVGPYETVQLHSTDPGALNAWLASYQFVIPPEVTPVLDAYVHEGFDFLAMKLLPGQGVQAMRPVRVSSPGASLSLPLRMAAIGTGDIVGITIWVVADGRYEPQNFPNYQIADSSLVWDWAAGASNYTTLREQNDVLWDHKGWEIESSLSLSQQIIVNAILSGGQSVEYGLGRFGTPAVSDPADDYAPVFADSPDGGDDGASEATPDGAPDGGDGGDDGASEATPDGAPDGGDDGASEATSDGGVTPDGGSTPDAEVTPNGPSAIVQTAAEVRQQDLEVLLAGFVAPTVRITRMRSNIAHAAMTEDLVLQASADQSEISNVRFVTHSVNETCPIYDGCNVVGSGTPAQSQASVGKGGCAATPHSRARSPVGSCVVAGFLGIALARIARRRRIRR